MPKYSPEDIYLSELRPATQAIRGGYLSYAESHSEPLYLTSSFVFESARQAADRFNGSEPGNIYSRFTNPTVRIFEERLAGLECAESCVATSSGMAAVLAIIFTFLKSGDEIVCSRSVFGATLVMFNNLQKFGIRTRFVSQTDVGEWEAAVNASTKLLFLETPSNPLCEIGDIRNLAKISNRVGALLVVDNCLCTPALQVPLRLGADLVIHSATKYLDGQGRCIGGAICGAKALIQQVHANLRSAGFSMSPFNAWVFLKGLETLGIRMEAHSRNARTVAEWLSDHPSIQRVYYPGLISHPQYDLAAEQQSEFGGILSFSVRGARDEAWRLIDNTRLLSITANLGDTKTTITHPATTTHSRLTKEEKISAGISENLVRLSVGLEDVRDILNDLEIAFEAV